MEADKQIKDLMQAGKARIAEESPVRTAVQEQKENRRLLYRAGYTGRRWHGAVLGIGIRQRQLGGKLCKGGFERVDPSGGAEFTGELFLYL